MTINAFDLMSEGLAEELARIRDDLRQVDKHSRGHPVSIVSVKPEESLDFNSDTPREVIYREIGRLDARRLTPYAMVNRDYVTSSLERYKQLSPLVDDPEVRSWVSTVIEGLEESVKTLDQYRN